MNRLAVIARVAFLLAATAMTQPVRAECQPDTKYLGTWNWLYSSAAGSVNWASCQALPTSSMAACWKPHMIAGFCGSGYHCKMTELYCAQEYEGRCIRIAQGVAGYRDSDGGFCCYGHPAVAVQTTDPFDDTCGPYVSVEPLDEQCDECNNVGDPINPASGGVFAAETDVAGPVPFQRFFNSATSASMNLSPGWSHSYSRRVIPRRAAGRFWPYGAGGGNSSQYATEQEACEDGFLQIRSQVTKWINATATFSGGSCNISGGGAASGETLQILYSVPNVEQPTDPLLGVSVIRDDGRVIRFRVTGGVIMQPKGIGLRLLETSTGFQIIDENDNVELYGASGGLISITSRSGVAQTMGYTSGKLSAVTDSFGHAISLAYDPQGRLATVTDSASGVYTYGYDAADRLATVTAPDATARTYLYENVDFPTFLTKRKDENNVVQSTWTYDAEGRGTHTEENGGANAVTLVYNADGSVLVTDALGAQRTFTYARVGDRYLVAGISGSQCPTCRDGAATGYDDNGFVSSRRDYNGNLSCYKNDTLGRELVRIEGMAPGVSACPADVTSYTPAAGTRERKISTAWHATFRLPTAITEANRSTAFTHDASGNVLTRTVTDTTVTPNVARTWTFTHDSFGRVLTEDGPRTDVTDLTTYTYHACTTGNQCGQASTATNAAGHVTSYDAYDAHAAPTRITDANGLVTSLAYDTRRRTKDICVGGTLPGCVGGELTHLDYWPTGLLKKVINPDGSFVQYTYDAAHRLTDIVDGAGNKIVYTLDAMGNRTAENLYDPGLVLKRTHSRVFNTLNQLWKEVNAAGTASVTTVFGYDSNGNQNSISAPLGRNSASLYDELDRLKQITDPASGITQFGYDANDNLTSVTDPRSLVTSYTYTGFGDLKTQTSPDTGLTTNTYDSGGNLKTSTDARSAITTYTYDSLNRVTSAAFKIGSTTDQTITFTYDGGTNQKGHLTGASDANHSMAWTYDAKGRVTSKSQVVGSFNKAVGYGYNALGQLTSLVLPSGKTIQYGYNANNQVTSVTLLGSPNVTILSSITYDPFGPVTGWTWGNGTTMTRTFDADGKLSQITSSGQRTFGYDDAFRITAANDIATPANSWTLGYDLLDRLSSATKTGTTIGYTYDANGNRLTQAGTSASTYTVSPTSNKLSSTSGALVRSYSYNDSGSVLTSGATTHTYYHSGRMKTGKLGAASITTYLYNALGQRVKKSGGGATTTLFMYDEAGHLVGEYNSSNALVQETIWLGDIPVATLRPNGANVTVFYVHTDQLNTPRKVTNLSNQLRWRWDPSPFGDGASALNENPASLGSFKYNLRFPGQYFDNETNLNYNYFRDYDPVTGRYVKSDPIGIEAGHATYGYSGDDPIGSDDPLGLNKRRTSSESRPPTPAEAAAAVRVPQLLQQIRSYRPNFRYSTVRPNGSRFNENDYRALERELDRLLRERYGYCPNPALENLASFREQLGITPGRGALARLDIGGRTFYGINSHGQPITMRVNPVTATHAEADAFQQAINAGVRGTRATLYVDRALCGYCGKSGGVAGMARQLGITELEVITPQGGQTVAP